MALRQEHLMRQSPIRLARTSRRHSTSGRPTGGAGAVAGRGDIVWGDGEPEEGPVEDGPGASQEHGIGPGECGRSGDQGTDGEACTV
jgi:hypothetical protein